MFYVVQLDSDIFKEKIVVPSIWLDKYDTLCLLPPVTDVAEVETLAKAQSTPKHGWQLHSVSFKQSFDTYSQANENITKGKPVRIQLKEEEEEQHDKEVRGKRKRKLPLFFDEYSVESDDDKEEGRNSTQDDCSMDYSVLPDPLIVKVEAIEDSNAPANHQQPRLSTTHNKSSSSVYSSLQHDNQLQVAESSSPTIRKKVTPTKKNSEIKDLLVSIWNKMNANESTECTKCDNLEDILKSKNQEIERLQNREHTLQERKEKYKEMKKKYKEKKKETKEPQEGKKFECGNLEDILKSKNQEIERLQKELQNREYSLQERKEKYKEMKKKYKEKKKESKEPQEGKKFECGNLEDILKSKNQEIERLQKELQNREHSLQKGKEKYKEMKKKYKEKKKESQEGKKFGSLVIAAEKLSLCRDKDYSKYVGDLLDICFGREILSKSVLKCPNKRTIKTNVLERDVINDIACHTIEKFSSVSIAMVRAAIRQKLNTCHKAKKIK